PNRYPSAGCYVESASPTRQTYTRSDRAAITWPYCRRFTSPIRAHDPCSNWPHSVGRCVGVFSLSRQAPSRFAADQQRLLFLDASLLCREGTCLLRRLPPASPCSGSPPFSSL